MPKDSIMVRMIKSDYGMIGLNIENTYKKTDLLLRLYRRVAWCVSDRLDELNEITYESCLGDTETLSYLLNFAPERELGAFQHRAVNAMKSRVLIDLIERAVVKIRDYPDNGGIYYSIIDLKYMNYFKYDEDEILEQLDIERSTYYRKKKEATLLLGYILFGVIMPEYIRNEKVANM